jgi:hypothetical protein
MRCLLPLLLWCACASVQAQPRDDAQAAMFERQAEATARYHARIATAMADSRDVREQAFAALLRQAAEGAPRERGGGSAAPAADARLRAIAARAGADVIANQLLLAAIADPASPERIAAVRRWLAVDPGSLAPLPHLGLAPDAMLAEARRATHARGGMYDAVRWMQAALLRHPLEPAERAALAGGADFDEAEAAALAAMALWSGLLQPAHGAWAEPCRGAALQASPGRADDCRHVASLLATEADGLLERTLGLSLLREQAATREARAAVDAQRRALDWQALQWGRVARQQPRDGAAQFVRLLDDPAIATEQQLMERVLQDAGIPLEPPANWTPPRY